MPPCIRLGSFLGQTFNLLGSENKSLEKISNWNLRQKSKSLGNVLAIVLGNLYDEECLGATKNMKKSFHFKKEIY